MKRAVKLVTITIALIISFSMVFSVHAAPKKTVYVLTKEKSICTDTPSYTYKYHYNKKGLLDSIKYSDTDKYKYKGTYEYNKKGQAVKQSHYVYKRGKQKEKVLVKFKYTKTGYLKSARFYCKKKNKSKNTLYYKYRVSWNKKKLVSKDYYYSAMDGEKVLEGYKYDKYQWSDQGLIRSVYECNYISNNKRIIKEYVSSDTETGKLFRVTHQTLRHGDVVSEKIYFGDSYSSDDLESKSTYTYKKLRLKKKDYNKVVKQQKYLQYLSDVTIGVGW